MEVGNVSYRAGEQDGHITQLNETMKQYKTRSSADADKPARRLQRSVNVTKHSTVLQFPTSVQ